MVSARIIAGEFVRMNRQFVIVLCSLVMLAIGCQKPAPQVDETKKGDATAAPRTDEASKSAPTDVNPPTDAAAASVVVPTKDVPADLTVTAAEGSAEAAFQQILVSFQRGQLDAAYDVLPNSYQVDVDKVLHAFADQMDPDVWASAFDLIRKFASVMKSKKTLILNFEPFKKSPQMELIKPHWDTFASGLIEFAQGDLADPARLKQSGVKKLLQSASKMLVGVPLPKFGDVTVKTVKSEGDTAVILYRESKASEPQEVVFVKVEDKWLPKSIVDNWSTTMRNANARVSDFANRCTTFKSAIKQNFDSLNDSLVKIQQAQSSEELSQAVIPMMFTIRLGVQSAQQAMMESPSSGQTVQIELNQSLTDDEQTKLKDAILAMVNSDVVDYEMVSTDGKTHCRFKSVPDVSAMVKLLEGHFPGASVRLNTDTNVIKVETK